MPTAKITRQELAHRRRLAAQTAESHGLPSSAAKARQALGLPGPRELAALLLAAWPEALAFCLARGLRADVRPALPKSPTICGSSYKIRLGEALGVLSSVVYGSPALESGMPQCFSHSAACEATCLGHSTGQLVGRQALLSRMWRTVLATGARALYRQALASEAVGLAYRAWSLAMIPALRADGSTDTGHGSAVARMIPFIQAYDYTKSEGRALNWRAGICSPNYHLTGSWSGANISAVRRMLAAGVNVAVPFSTPRGAEFPARFLGAQVDNGDLTDYRPGDYRAAAGQLGRVIALAYKGTGTGARDSAGRDRQALAAGSFVVSASNLAASIEAAEAAEAQELAAKRAASALRQAARAEALQA